MEDFLLSDEILEKTKLLPSAPSPITLFGRNITLKPLNKEQDSKLLYNFSNGSPQSFQNKEFPAYDPEIIWQYLPYGPFNTFEDFSNNIDKLLARPRSLMFSIYINSENIPIGSISLINNYSEHLKVEIGSVWVSPVAQRTGICAEACFLLLDHVFKLGYRRVEWRCRILNVPSYKFAIKIGFVHEFVNDYWGVIDKAFRHCVWLRILDFEWIQGLRVKYVKEILKEEL
jgi:RimJ/RimL family protein N-acetyltransferase